MGLFGSKFSGQNLLDFALGGYGGLDRRRNMDQADQAKTAFGNASDAVFGGVPMLPAVPNGSGPMDQIATYAQGDRPVSTPSANPYAAIFAAAGKGADVNPLLDYMKSQQPKTFNTSGGIVNIGPDGKATQVYSDPNAALDRQETQSRINYNNKRSTGKQVIEAKDGLYEYDPVTGNSRKLQSWAAYAPPRIGAGKGKGSSEAPPSGFVLD